MSVCVSFGLFHYVCLSIGRSVHLTVCLSVCVTLCISDCLIVHMCAGCDGSRSALSPLCTQVRGWNSGQGSHTSAT